MKKKALWKDIWKEVSNNKARFIALLAIITLGVGFYAGISAAGPDMLKIANNYYRDNQLFDLKILSTYGIVDKDIEAIEEVHGLTFEAVSTIDVAVEADAYLLKLYPYQAGKQSMNNFEIESGRLPQKTGEIALDASQLLKSSYQIGDQIHFDIDNQEESADEEATIQVIDQSYTVVGFVHSPIYIENISRGNTTVGKGTLDGFGVVVKNDIIADIYSEVYGRFNNSESLIAYTEEYESLVDKKANEVEVTLNGRPIERINEIRNDARKELFDAEKELESARQQLKDAEEELLSARQELDEGRAEYEANQALFDREIAAGQAQLAQEQAKLDKAWADYRSGLDQWQENARSYADAQANWQIQRDQLLQQLDAAVSLEALAENPIPTPEGKALGEQIQLLLDGEAEVESAQSQLEIYGESLQAQEQLLEEGQADLLLAKDRLNQIQSDLTAAETALQSQTDLLANRQSQLQLVKEILQTPYDSLTEEQKSTYLQALNDQGARTDLFASTLAYLKGEATADTIPLSEEERLQSSLATGINQQTETVSRLQSNASTLQATIKQAETDLLDQGQMLTNAKNVYATSVANLDQKQKELTQAKNILQNKVQLAMQDIQNQVVKADKQFEDQADALEAARTELAAGLSELESGQAEIDKAYSQLNAEKVAGQEALDDALQQLEEGEADYSEGFASFELERIKAEDEIADGEAELATAKQELADLDTPVYFVQDRTVNPGYQSYRDNADRISAIATIFPIFFFLIAALVSFTTMTRMVDEQRQQMGTLKGLGYGNLDIAKKFVVYAAAACFGGTVLGLLIGYNLFPRVIVKAYSALYTLPELNISYYLSYGILSLLVALLCTIGPAAYTAHRALKESPASMMRPKSPKNGKRVLLERLPFIWNHLGFNGKITVRNLVRYKLRNSMTIIGVAGSTALILTGFAITNSISGLARIQFSEIATYDAVVALAENQTAEAEAGYQQLKDAYSQLDNSLLTLQASYKADRPSISTQDVTIFVPETTDNLADFVKLKDRKSDESYQLTDDGIIVTEKLARLMAVEVGDELVIRDDQEVSYRMPVQAITENYTGHTIYLTAALYEEIFSERFEANTELLTFKEKGDWERQFAEESMEAGYINLITFIDTIDKQFSDTLEILDLVTVVLIISAAALAFIVLYNLTNVNVSERIRELSTIKVLGFYHTEVSMYIYRETLILSLLGILAGFGLGRLLTVVILGMVEVDFMLFPITISLSSYLYSFLLTILFSMIVMVIMHYKLKHVDMIEALKSVE